MAWSAPDVLVTSAQDRPPGNGTQWFQAHLKEHRGLDGTLQDSAPEGLRGLEPSEPERPLGQ